MKTFPIIELGACLLCMASIAGSTAGTDPEPAREINGNGTCSQLKCQTKDHNNVTLRYMSGHAIENHTITANRTWLAEMEGEIADCIRGCIDIPSCITVLVGKEERKCWLYEGDDVYVHPETIQPKEGYKIISLGNGVCKYQPCNNGTCVPNFDGTGKFTCACDSGYVGLRCEERGADIHFSFDKDTSHTNSKMADLKMELVQAKLVRVPDRRGRVLMVKEGQTTAVKMDMKKAAEYGTWMNEPFHGTEKQNMTVTFWLKMDSSWINSWRTVIGLSRWFIKYHGKAQLLKAFIASDGDALGANNKMNVQCGILQIQKWTFVTLAMSGPAGLVKMYINGDFCDSQDVSGVAPTSGSEWHDHTWEKFLFDGTKKGISLIDELKFYHSFPASDDVIMEDYLKERKEYMG